MNDDQLRSELERRSRAGAPDEQLLSALRPALVEPVTKSRRSFRLAPIGGLAAAVAIVVLVVATLPSLTPSASPTESGDPAGSRGVASEIMCELPNAGQYGQPVVVNETGLRITCADPQLSGDPFTWRPPVSNPDGDTSRLRINWSGSLSDSAARFTLSRTNRGFALQSRLPDGSSRAVLVHYALVLEIHDGAIRASQVAVAQFEIAQATPNPTTQEPSVDPSQSAPLGVQFGCPGMPLPPESTPYAGPVPRVIDETGLITGCIQTDVSSGPHEGVGLSNPFSPIGLNVEWASEPCDHSVVFTFRQTSGGYELVGDRPTVCDEGQGGPPLEISFSRAMPADSVRASFAGSTASPPITKPSPTPAHTVTHECGDDIATFVDRTGRVRGCSIATDRGVPSTDATIGEREALVSLAWPVMLDNACQPLPSVVTAWGPIASLTDDDYVIQVTTLAISSGPTTLPGGGECDAATGMHYLDLTVEEQADWGLIHEIETSSARLRSSTGVEVDAGSFGLTLTSPGRSFAAGEPIIVEAQLDFTGPDDSSTVDLSSNGIGTLFSLEQIDGDIRHGSGAQILPCADRVNIGSESGIVNYLRFPSEWSSDDPNAAFYDQYTRDELLTLPPGRYLIRATFEAAISQDCGGERLELQTGVVIEVR